MALEAGEQMHEVFAVVRLWQLEHKQGLAKHAVKAGERIFTPARWKQMQQLANDEAPTLKGQTPGREHLISLAFAALHTGEFYDDPSDDVRTISNLELASIAYIDARLPVMTAWPIWVEDERDHTKRVGVEQVFDVVLEFADGLRIRVIGTIDGLSIRLKTKVPHLDENKTASRLDDGWKESFLLAHQITGYCAATTTLFGFAVMNAHIFGVKLKPGKYGDNIYDDVVSRDEYSIRLWANWVRFVVTVLHQPFAPSDFEASPRFTHSCNRYFRSCSLLHFCADTPEGRLEQYDQMIPREPSPSERAIAKLYAKAKKGV